MYLRHRSPYKAVVTLCVTTAAHWRTLRAKLMLAGIADPLNDLPDLHALLDVAEVLMLESLDEKDRDKLLNQLYAPDFTPNGDGYKAAPAGFDEEDQMASFDAFAAVAK